MIMFITMTLTLTLVMTMTITMSINKTITIIPNHDLDFGSDHVSHDLGFSLVPDLDVIMI